MSSDLRQSSPPLRDGDAHSQSMPTAIAQGGAVFFSATPVADYYELPKTTLHGSETGGQTPGDF